MRSWLKTTIRNLTKKGFRKVGFEVLRADRVPHCNVNLLEMACWATFGVGEVPTLMQIGANDGRQRDPVMALLQQRRLRAILVDPLEENCKILKERYGSHPEITCLELAVAAANGEAKIFLPKNPKGNLGSQIATFDKCHLIRHGISESNITYRSVVTRTIDSIIVDLQLAEIDIFVCDTEGTDFMIVTQLLCGRYFPKILFFENCNMTQPKNTRCARC